MPKATSQKAADNKTPLLPNQERRGTLYGPRVLHVSTELIPKDPPGPDCPAIDLQSIVEDCKAALKFDPDNLECMLSLANALSDLGELGLALREYDEIVRRFPSSAKAFHFRANTNARMGEFKSALEDYAQSDQLDLLGPDNADNNVDWSWHLLTCTDDDLRKPSEAVTRAKEAETRIGRRPVKEITPTQQALKSDSHLCQAAAYTQSEEFESASLALLDSEGETPDRRQIVRSLIGQAIKRREPFLPGDLTKPTWTGQSNPMKARGQETDSDAFAAQVLFEKRNDPQAVINILASANLPAATREQVVKWGTKIASESPEQLLARNVTQLRDSIHWSQRDLAKETGISHGGIQRIEKATVSCLLDTLCVLAAAFKRSPRALLFPDSVPTSTPVKPSAARKFVAERLRSLVPDGPSPHKSFDGIVSRAHSPSLATLAEVAASVEIPLVDLLP